MYNETLRDLLAADGAPPAAMEIKHGRDGNTVVTGQTKHMVNTPADVRTLLRRAAAARATAATLSNAQSSRSHSVFQLTVRGRCAATSEERSGCLTMVDLAGSERLDKSGATGSVMKETQAINKSLSALGDVIFALANGDKHGEYCQCAVQRSPHV